MNHQTNLFTSHKRQTSQNTPSKNRNNGNTLIVNPTNVKKNAAHNVFSKDRDASFLTGTHNLRVKKHKNHNTHKKHEKSNGNGLHGTKTRQAKTNGTRNYTANAIREINVLPPDIATKTSKGGFFSC